MNAATPIYFQCHFPPIEFEARRQAVMDRIGPDAVAVVAGAGGSGAFDIFRQTNEFFYLSGVEVPHAYLLMDGGRRQSTLYLPHHDPRHERSEGAQLHCDIAEQVAGITGIEQVAPLAQLAHDISTVRQIYLPTAPGEGRQACRDTLRYEQRCSAADLWDQLPTREEQFRKRILAAAPNAEGADLTPILDSLRLLKSDNELALMQQAGTLAARAVRAAMKQTRPGLFEYQLAAIADGIYADGGAQGAGYRAIVASGANIWNAHYFRNCSQLQAGDLVLMDYAPDIGCYTSDIGRMWPVNGRYSDVQRELYGFVVTYHEALLKAIRPRRTVAELAREAEALVRPVWEAWPFSKPVYREAASKMIASQVAFTHPVGMSVHDVGAYEHAPLQPGLVFALDPQMWIEEESLYVRVEDAVAVTEYGVRSLTAEAPLRLRDVEAAMRSAD